MLHNIHNETSFLYWVHCTVTKSSITSVSNKYKQTISKEIVMKSECGHIRLLSVMVWLACDGAQLQFILLSDNWLSSPGLNKIFPL